MAAEIQLQLSVELDHSPPLKHLYHWYGVHWHVYWPIWQTSNYIEYPAQPIIRNQLPDNSQPAMPTLQPWHIRLRLSLPKQVPHPPDIEPQHLSLAQQIQKLSHQWAMPLWHQIHWHAPIGQLKQTNVQWWPIILVSNTLVSAWHNGTCTWVIWSITQLWSREGIVPNTTDNLYSRLAEVYGICSAL